MPRTLEVPRIPERVKRKSLMTVSPVKPAHRSTWRRTAEGGGKEFVRETRGLISCTGSQTGSQPPTTTPPPEGATWREFVGTPGG